MHCTVRRPLNPSHLHPDPADDGHDDHADRDHRNLHPLTRGGKLHPEQGRFISLPDSDYTRATHSHLHHHGHPHCQKHLIHIPAVIFHTLLLRLFELAYNRQ